MVNPDRFLTNTAGGNTDEEIAYMQSLIEPRSPGEETTQPVREETTRPASTPRGKYPWHEWTNGEYHIILRGKDYETTPTKMQTMLYRRAEDVDLKVKSEKIRDTVTGNVMLGFMFGKTQKELDAKWAAEADK